jgi:glutathione S-transferase
VDQWLDFVQQYHLALSDADIHAALSFLNSHLELRTYLAGYTPTLADVAVYVFLQVRAQPRAAHHPALITASA